MYTCICFFLQILIICVELDEGLFLEMHVQHFFRDDLLIFGAGSFLFELSLAMRSR